VPLPLALRDRLGAAMTGAGTPLDAANQLCHACVEMLDVDGASVSLIHEGSSRGTFGSSGQMSRRLDELQFTYGEGPCLDAVRAGSPIMVEDLNHADEVRWPAFRDAAINAGIGAVFALPVTIASTFIGALDLFSHRPGPLRGAGLAGALCAAELASVPLLDLMTADVDWDSAARGDDGWHQLDSLERVEVYHATGMLMAALNVPPAEALARLRAHAFAQTMTASDVAWAILERRLTLHSDGAGPASDPTKDSRK
jgi:hypothetical protein